MEKQIAIVGAGPGGIAAAIRLAQRGVKDVVLLERDHFPRDKTCASGLSPGAMALLDEFGLQDEVRRRGYAVNSMQLTTPGKRVIQIATKQAAVVLLRREFDQLLLDRALALGVEIRQGFHAMRLLERRGRVMGVVGRDGQVEADYVLCADGAHSVFSVDPRQRRTLATLMGWWENFPFEPGRMEMVFDRRLSPNYGWLFPETATRVNIGICLDSTNRRGDKRSLGIRTLFQQFLDEYFGDRIKVARQVGVFRGHPITHTVWVDHCTRPGVLYLGEAARLTNNTTGEGIWQAMQSGVYAAEAVVEVVTGLTTEELAWRRYLWRLRRRLTPGFALGYVLRGLIRTPLLEVLAMVGNNPQVRRVASQVVSSALTATKMDAAAELPVGAPVG
jgi:menaquinone-9 beta-reductase